ncbi:unnamed protein product [Mytilus edulis]|uniref:Integrase catalytic domain-containing protein n=1 Tax=Mytilus edulis TaxID=6550 RepID=A0A8S3UHP1_MYTED|nr:unnamed protein product [Mytilus edulis]
MSWKDYLRNIYFNPSNPASFSGPEKIFAFVKKDGKYTLSKYKIRKWLHNQESYSIQRQAKRPHKRTHIIVAGIDDQWSADLMDMVKFSKYNDGFSYILVVIDTFSKYLWLRKLKDKKGSSVAKAFEDILKTRSPKRIRTDKGQEFRSRLVQDVFQKRGIHHFYALNEVKASVSERAIKTIKTKIYRYFTYKQTYRYIEKLQSFADAYNHTVHRTIDMPPAEVTNANEEIARLSTYFSSHSSTKPVKRLQFRYKKGDKVRITHLRNVFSREYDQKWTGEIFTVFRRYWRGQTQIYRIKDYNNDKITGSFYQSELQKVELSDNEQWKIEKIIKGKGTGRNKQYFVKWLNWPVKFNSWVKASDVKDL